LIALQEQEKYLKFLEDAEDIHEIILREAFENVESYLKNV
jgi:hypothetical protein